MRHTRPAAPGWPGPRVVRHLNGALTRGADVKSLTVAETVSRRGKSIRCRVSHGPLTPSEEGSAVVILAMEQMP